MAGQRVQADRQRRHQGLAFAGAHLGDPTLVKHDTAHELDIEVTHADGTLAGLTHQCEDFHQFLVEDLLYEGGPFAGLFGQLRSCRSDLQFDGLEPLAQSVIGKTLDLGLVRVDGRDHRLHPFEISLVFGAEHGANRFFEQVHPLTSSDCKMPGLAPAQSVR